MTVTSAIKGTAGNAYTLTTDATGAAVSSVTADMLDGGIAGTVGTAYELAADASYLYYCIATNTAVDANWRRMTLGAVY